MRFFILIAILSGSLKVRAQETEYGVCSLTDDNRAKIEIYQRLVTSKKCGLTAYRDMLVGNPLAKPNVVNSNGIGTAKQLDALYEVIAKSKKLTLNEKKENARNC